MITGKRGKPTVSEKLMARLVKAHNPRAAAPRVFSELDTRFGIPESMDIASKCSDIAKMVAKANESMKAEAASTSSPDDLVVSTYPWMLNSSPENVIHEAEKAATVNDQVVSALMAHLVNHLIIGDGLRRVAMRAQLDIVKEVDETPKEFKDLILALRLEGVTTKPVSRLSKKRIRQIAEVIKGISGKGSDDLPVNDDECGESTGSVENEGENGPGSLGDESSCPELPELRLASDGSAPTTSPRNTRIAASDSTEADSESSDDGYGSASAGFETIIDPVSDSMARMAAKLGYTVFERVASSDADRAALHAIDPPEGVEYYMLGAERMHRMEIPTAAVRGQLDRVEKLFMAGWVAAEASHAGDRELARRWSWQLVGLAGRSDPPRYPVGWWSGLVVKSPDPSGTKVRELRSVVA